MNLKDLFFFTGKCLTLNKNPIHIKSIETAFSLDYIPVETFISLCSNHFVLPAIYAQFKHTGLLSVFPPDLSEHLKEIYELNTERNQLIASQVREICTKLQEKNIEPLFLKGTGNLLDNLYVDAAERMIGDIDFLVHEKDYLETARLIMELGYRNDTKDYVNIKTLKHYPRLFKPGVPADIEIHRLPVPEKHLKKFNTNLVFQQKKAIEGITNCYTLCDEHKMTINFIHGQLSNKGYLHKITSLRDVYDYYLLTMRVSPEKAASNIEQSAKAKAYFFYAQQVLGQPGLIAFNSTATRIHVILSNLALENLRIFAAYRMILLISNLIFIRYGLKIIESIYKKSSRQYIWKRMKDREWYAAHFNSLKKMVH